MNTIYETFTEKFYLLSIKNRRLIDLNSKSKERTLEQEVEKAFSQLPIREGGNIYAVYVYDSSVMAIMNKLSNRFKIQYPQIQQLPAYFKDFKEGDVFIRHNYSAPLLQINICLHLHIGSLFFEFNLHKKQQKNNVLRKNII